MSSFSGSAKKPPTWLIVAIVAMAVFRFVLGARVGLGDDEAYYWEWSRHLELSYYDHPAMVAWLIKAGTALFGQNPFAVRFFGLACNTASGVLLWMLASDLFGGATAALALALYWLAPIFCLGGLLMVPDAPMGTAWMAVALLSWKILGRGEDRWSTWLVAGLALGLGLLSKYTIVLLAGSVVLLLLTEKDWRVMLARPRFWSAVAVAASLCLPIILWNIGYGWPTLKFHLHDRHTGGGGANFSRWGQFFVTQSILLGPALLVLCWTVWGRGLRRWSDRRWRFLTVLTLPTFALFCLQALFAEFKPHWPAPAYSLLLIGAAELWREGWQTGRRWVWGAVAALVLVIIVPINILFYAGSVWPVIPKVARLVAPSAPWESKFDPTNDLYGWERAIDEARQLRDEAVARGEAEPFLSSSRYQLVAQLAFASQERVWRVSPGNDQYLFWQTPGEWQPLVGRDAIFITDQRFERDPRGDRVFKDCELKAPVLYYRGSELARQFNIWYCRGFLGLASQG